MPLTKCVCVNEQTKYFFTLYKYILLFGVLFLRRMISIRKHTSGSNATNMVSIYKHFSNHMYTGTKVVKIDCSPAARVYILLTLKIADSLCSVEYLYSIRLLGRLDLCSDLRVFLTGRESVV